MLIKAQVFVFVLCFLLLKHLLFKNDILTTENDGLFFIRNPFYSDKGIVIIGENTKQPITCSGPTNNSCASCFDKTFYYSIDNSCR